jgi:hypothetical protein
MKLAACFWLLSVCVGSTVLADDPPSPAPQPPAAQAPAPLPNAPSSAGDAQAAAGAPAAPAAKSDKSEKVDAGATDAEIKQMRSRGYKPVSRNGTLVFCRDESEIGSHFQRTHCSTLKQLKDAELSGKEYVNSIQQQGSAVQFKGP